MDSVWIELTRGYFTLIDRADYERVTQFSWYAQTRKSNRLVYASRGSNAGRVSPYGCVSKHRYLHRYIVDAPDGFVVDHINGDPLDNRRANLRVVTQSQNIANSRVYNPSGFKGVTPRGDRWVAQIRKGSRIHVIGTYDLVEDAAKAFDDEAYRLHGKCARLNFPRSA